MIFPCYFIVGIICIAWAEHEKDGWHLYWQDENNKEESMIFSDASDMYNEVGRMLGKDVEFHTLYGPMKT